MENYKLLPETGPRYQLIQGDLYMAPAPNRFNPDGSEIVTELDENQTLTSPLLPGWSLAGSALYER